MALKELTGFMRNAWPSDMRRGIGRYPYRAAGPVRKCSQFAWLIAFAERCGAVIAAVMLLTLGAGAAHAQDSAVGSTATRSALAQRVAADESELAERKLKSSRRSELTGEVTALKERLDSGDFKTGDLIVVTVITTQSQKVDTATVRDNGMISISNMPDMSVKGLLRSELLGKVTQHVETYLKFPQVRVNYTTRVTVVGAVGRPGTVNLSPDRSLTELVPAAGGGAPNAKLDQLEVRRGKRVILSYKDSKRALVQGKTLEQVGILPGDEVTIPAKHGFSFTQTLQILGIVSTLLFTLITFLRYYYSDD